MASSPRHWDTIEIGSYRKDLRKLEPAVRREAHSVVRELANNPFPSGAEILQGYAKVFRVYFYRSAYRLIYEVHTKTRKLILLAAGPRDTVYHGFKKPGPPTKKR